jgi:translation initiation factor 1 (eIF-1/SUI1)
MTSLPRHIACFCETSFDADLPTSADMTGDPEIEQLILDGSFMAVTCPGCGRRLTPEYPFRLTGVSRFGELFLVPEADRGAYDRGTLEYDTGAPGRIVVGFPELGEKVLIARLGLDDRVIEIMKYYLLTGSASAGNAEQEKEITIVYRGKDAGRHVFNIVGMKDGEIGIARLAEELYSRIASDVDARITEDPFRDFCAPPWVSLRRITGAAG